MRKNPKMLIELCPTYCLIGSYADELNKCRKLKLFPKTQVVFEKEANISDAIFAYSKSFYAETKGSAGIFFAVYSRRVNNKALFTKASPTKMS